MPSSRASLKPEKALANWRALIRALPRMNDEELQAALEYEKNGAKRQDFLFRISRRIVAAQNEANKQKLGEFLNA